MRMLLWPRYDGRHPTCALVLGVCGMRLNRVTTMRWWSLLMESTPVGEHDSIGNDAIAGQVGGKLNDNGECKICAPPKLATDHAHSSRRNAATVVM